MIEGGGGAFVMNLRGRYHLETLPVCFESTLRWARNSKPGRANFHGSLPTFVKP